MMTPLDDVVLRQTVTIAADAIICVSADHTITFFNDGAVAIFGYTAAEIIGEPLERLLPERFHAAHRGHIQRFAGAPVAARRMGERQAISGRRKDGTEFPAEAAITHMETADGQAFSVVLRDVTERHRIEGEKQKLVRELQESVAARDEMLSIVSHDLRNPVNAAKMLSAAIVRSDDHAKLPEQVLEHARIIGQAALQMDTLIQDLLDVSRIESGRLRLSPQPIRVVSLLARSVEMLAPMAEEAGVLVTVEVDDGTPDADVDPDRMGQVLSNLVGNALKFTPRGGSVRLTASDDHEDVHIVIADTGTGIPAADLPKVFDRFWQSKRTNRSGAGLGLTIARGIVRAHGGRIWIESDAGTGTRVHFTVPAAR
jgi:PAS domain S-box-containing protein